MLKRHLYSCLIGLMFICASGYCDSQGTSGAQFLKIVSSPRAAALGGAFTAFDGDVNTIAFNPAGLAFMENSEVSLVQNNWIQGISNQYLALGLATKAGTFGLSADILSIGNILERDNTGAADGTSFGSSDMSISVSYAKSFGERFSVGLTGKSISQKIETVSASSIAGDLGIIYKLSQKINIGASVLNVGSGIKFIDETDPLPTTIKAGIMYQPVQALKIGVDGSQPNDADTDYGIGAEYSIKVGEKLVFPLRAGYRSGYQTEDLSGLAAGCGVMYNNALGVDFAWVPMGILGDTMRFGVTYKF